MDHSQLAKQAEVSLLQALDGAEQAWKFHKDKGGVKVHKRKHEIFDIKTHQKKKKTKTMWKFEYDLEGVHVEKAFKCFVPPLRFQWDDSLNHEESKVIEVIKEEEPTILLYYSKTKPAAGGAISARDFVDLTSSRVTEAGGRITCSRSVLDERMPEKKGAVRGANYHGGHHIEPMDDGKSCKITMVFQSDIKGMVPSSLVEAAMADTGVRILTGLHKFAKEYSE